MVGAQRAVESVQHMEKVVPVSARLQSLDVFRGLTIASMMLVNNPGSWDYVYAPLRHAEWHGWTFTDTVFPFFLWISGVAMTFSFAKRVESGADRGKLLLHTLQRAAIIFLIGMFLNGFPRYDLATIRVPGVLQRIAVCYLIAGVVFLYCSKRVQAMIAAGCLLGYWGLMSWVSVPGCGAGSLAKGCNFAQYVDSMFLSGHMWSSTKTWDPEGIVSTIPAIATTLFGVFTGYLLRSTVAPMERIVWLFFGGNLLMFLGVIWDHVLPINKNLWTSSFTVFMAGLAMAVFAGCYWLIDYKGWKRWSKPFAIYGANAIFVYVVAGLLSRVLGLLNWKQPMFVALTAIASPIHASLLYAIGNVLVLYLVAWGMHKKGWIVRV